MVEVARRAGEARGSATPSTAMLDAEQMDLDDSSVDGVLCRFGYMLMADPAAALAETRRVLRDGGKLSFAVWAGPDRNLWAAIPGMTMVERAICRRPSPERRGSSRWAIRTGSASSSPAPGSASRRSRRSRSSGATTIRTRIGRRRSRSPRRSPTPSTRFREGRDAGPTTVAERVTEQIAEDRGLDGRARRVAE